MPAQWRISHWPACEKHAFLTHCAEDRETLVLPVCTELKCRGIIPWIDYHHYPIGREGFEALREELLKCRHVVYFITPAMLRQGRGWSNAERAFVATIQQYLRYGDEVAHVELPLLFVPRSDAVFLRSIWRSLIDKAIGCPHPAQKTRFQKIVARLVRVNTAFSGLDDGCRRWLPEHVRWAAGTIEDFVRQEEQFALELGSRFGQDHRARQKFEHDRNLMRRLLARAPRPLPPPYENVVR